MDGNYRVAMKSIIGTRDEQQDRAFYYAQNNRVFAVVCDGMGGMAEGGLASTAAVEKMKELFSSRNIAEEIPFFLIRAVHILDECVCSLRGGDGGKLTAGTTIVAVVIEDDELYWMSVGDSRLYLLRGDEIVRATRDHNYFLALDELKRDKQIDRDFYEAEAIRGEALISYIGMGGVRIMDFNEKPFRLRGGDTVLLTTDGLYKALPDGDILQHMIDHDVDSALGGMIAHSSKRSPDVQDNTTCIAIRYDGGGITI